MVGGVKNSRWFNVFRNLSFASEFKAQILREMINGIN